MNNAKLLASVMLLSPAVPGYAQNYSETRNAPTTASVYAQNDITLGLDAGQNASFSTTTVGFEAVIRKPTTVGGRWSPPLTWTDYVRPVADGGNGSTQGLVGIHTHVLPDGKVLSWEGHNDDIHLPGGGTTMTHAYEWNPNPAAIGNGRVYPFVYNHYDTPQGNLFCSGHTLLKDGRLLVAGGHYSTGLVQRGPGPPYNAGLPINNPFNPDYIPYIKGVPAQNTSDTRDVDSYIGLRDANTFNFLGDKNLGNANYVWQQRPSMQYRRWYPTVTTLADGNALVTAGQKYGSPTGTNGGPIHADIPELYNANTNTWQPLSNTASRVLPLYPLMFLAPDGQVFNAGPNSDTKFLNPNSYAVGTAAAQTWGATYNAHYGSTRGYGTAAMYLPGKILSSPAN